MSAFIEIISRRDLVRHRRPTTSKYPEWKVQRNEILPQVMMSSSSTEVKSFALIISQFLQIEVRQLRSKSIIHREIRHKTA